MAPLLVLAQAGAPVGQQFLNAVTSPNTTVTVIMDLAKKNSIPQTLNHIGLAMLALFALLEVYRLWIASDTGGLVVLGVKVIIVNYFITTSQLDNLLLGIYKYFAGAGEYMLASEIQTDLNKLSYIYFVFQTGGSHGLLWAVEHFIPIMFGDFLMLLYILVAAILLALYVFAVVMSRLFIVLSIMLIPIVLPLTLWSLISHSFIGKWVSTTVHAILLPLIAALALIIALRLGALAPLETIANCIAAPGGNVFSCIGLAAGAFVGGLIASLAGIFLMFGLDGIVRSFVGGTEISAAGVMAFRMLAGTPGRMAQTARAAGAARQAAAPQTIQRETTNIDSGDVRREKITTSKIPQTEA